MTPLAELARRLFGIGLAAVDPRRLLHKLAFLPEGFCFGEHSFAPRGKLVLVAVGKAGATMATAFLERSPRPADAVFVYVPHGSLVPEQASPHTRFGSHPGVGAENAAHTAALVQLLESLDPADGVLLLLSGGASALLSLPLPGLEVATLDRLTWELLRRGAGIGELNTVRKHLSQALGGRLATRCPAALFTLVLADVPGEELHLVGSGPTLGDPTTREQALEVLERFGLVGEFPEAVAVLQQPGSETPKPGDPALGRAVTKLLGSSEDALAAVARELAAEGFRVQLLTRSLRGEARSVGRALGALLATANAGAAFLAAGETTVRVRGSGVGGRNLELALAASLALAGSEHRCLLAAATDGKDGTSPAAGAVVDGQTLRRGRKARRDPLEALAANDAWGFFAGQPEAIVTGPTGTNVADLVIALAAPRREKHLPRPAAGLHLPSPPPSGAAKRSGGER